MKSLTWLALGTLLVTSAGCNKVKDKFAEQIEKLRDSGDEGEVEPPGAPQHTTRLTDRSYGAFINQPDTLVVVAFSADWCAPCRELAPVLDKLAGEFGDAVRLGRVNVDHSRATANLAGVSNIPDVRLFRDGRDIARFTGAKPEAELRELFKRHASATASAEGAATEEGGESPPAIRPMEKNWLPPGVERR